ncbi:MAG: hypothetical protein R2789_14460 [Microthrixaceae bacterium]
MLFRGGGSGDAGDTAKASAETRPGGLPSYYAGLAEDQDWPGPGRGPWTTT